MQNESSAPEAPCQPNQAQSRAKSCSCFFIGCGGVVFIGLVFLLLILKHSGKNPVVKDGYYKKVKSSFPLEKKYSSPGSFEVKSVVHKNSSGVFENYKIWYPAELEQAVNERYPVVVFANGTGVVYSRYEPIFSHLSSWGFIAVGNDDPSSASGKSTSMTLDYVSSLNSNQESVFYGKIDLNRIGVSGHSQGGTGAAHAATEFENKSVIKSIYTASNASPPTRDAGNAIWWYNTSEIKAPYFMVAATGRADASFLAPLASLREGFNKIPDGVPAVMARRRNIDHGDTLTHADGYMTAWFCFTLKGDQEAKQVFFGSKPEILENKANWQDVEMRNMGMAD